MKILVYEMICAGGYYQSPPEDMLSQGRDMLEAVLKDVAALSPKVSVYTVLDHRWAFETPGDCRIVAADDNWLDVWQEQLRQCDAALVIAPEGDQQLETFCMDVWEEEKVSLNCGPEAIHLCADKLALNRFLRECGVAAVETRSIKPGQDCDVGGVIKPRDGAGCEHTWRVTTEQCCPAPKEPDMEWIWQPWCEGTPVSLSLRFTGLGVEVLSLNRLLWEERDGVLSNPGVEVGVLGDDKALHKKAVDLAVDLESFVEDLRGYVGVDAIWDGTNLALLEINPRITLAYAGLKRDENDRSLGEGLLDAHGLSGVLT